MKRIHTRHRIAAPPANVWTVLTDFAAYAEWNPLNVWADGEARLGDRVPMRVVDAGGGKGKVIAQTVTIRLRAGAAARMGRPDLVTIYRPPFLRTQPERGRHRACPRRGPVRPRP